MPRMVTLDSGDEEIDDLRHDARRRTRRIRVILALLFVVPLAWLAYPKLRGWIGFPLSEAQRAQVDAAIAERERLASELDRQVHRELESLSGRVPRPDLGRCPRGISEPGGAEGMGASVLPGDAPWPLSEATSVAAFAHQRSQLALEVDEDVRQLRRDRNRRFDSADGPEQLLHRHLEIFAPSSYEVFFVRTEGPAVEDSLREPVTTLAGTAYLYDNALHRFVCGAEVRAHSSDQVEYVEYLGDESGTRSSVRSALAGDLRAQLYRAIAQSLVPLGPPLQALAPEPSAAAAIGAAAAPAGRAE